MLLTTKIATRSKRSVVYKQSYFSAGNNGYGQLAINNSSIFPNVFTPPVVPYTGVEQPDNWAKWAMRSSSIAAIKSDGTLWVAGESSYGQLGFGNTTHLNKMTKVNVETFVGSGIYKTDWVSVGVGTEHISALDAAGNIWSAGRNDIAAVIGNGSATGNVTTFYNTALTVAPYRESPIVFKQIIAGHRFVYGLDLAGEIWSWGNNGSRQLGRATIAGSATQDIYHRKVDIAGPWLKAFGGGYHGGGLHSDGELYTWGLYSNGQRGPGVVSQDPAIVARIGGVPWVDAYMGENSTFLRNVNGDLYAMGVNTNGELGIGNTTSPITTPTQIPGSWRHMSIDWWHAAGIKTDGTLWTWGTNLSGQLGTGNSTSRSSPGQIGTDTDWINTVTSLYSTTAIKQV